MRAPPSRPSAATIWRRRVLLMLGVWLVVAIPVTLLIRGGDESGGSSAGERSVEERLPLNPTVGDRRIDATYNVPEGWKFDREGGAVVLTSNDETVRIGIASPGRAGATNQVLDQALGSIDAIYDEVEVNPGSGKRIGGLPATGAVVAARAGGADLRVLVAVAKGKKRAYLVEVFTASGAKPRRVAEAQRFLNSLKLEG